MTDTQTPNQKTSLCESVGETESAKQKYLIADAPFFLTVWKSKCMQTEILQNNQQGVNCTNPSWNLTLVSKVFPYFRLFAKSGEI